MQFTKTKIIIMDACRNNPFLEIVQEALTEAGDGRSVGRGLASISELGQQQIAQVEVKTYGTIIAYAAAPGATRSESPCCRGRSRAASPSTACRGA